MKAFQLAEKEISTNEKEEQPVTMTTGKA